MWKTNTNWEEKKTNYTYIEEMRSQAANRIFCNVRRQCVNSCPEGKHTDLLVSICYPCRNAPSEHLHFYFGRYFIQFGLNDFGGWYLNAREKKTRTENMKRLGFYIEENNNNEFGWKDL